MNNKNGFTLIELLAVIVVLAVIMLVATTSVVPMMERAKKQAFITDANTIIKGAESYFMYKDMTGGAVNGFDKANPGTYMGVSYGKISYKCVDISDLIGEYVELKDEDKYYGTVIYDKTKNYYQIYVTDDENFIFTDRKTDGLDFLNRSVDQVVKEVKENEYRFNNWKSGWEHCNNIKAFVNSL